MLSGIGRRQDRVLAAHHDEGQVRPRQAHRGQQVEDRGIAEIDVGHHHVAFAIAHPALQRFGRAGGPHLIAGGHEGLVHDQPDTGIVLSKKNRFLSHAELLYELATIR